MPAAERSISYLIPDTNTAAPSSTYAGSSIILLSQGNLQKVRVRVRASSCLALGIHERIGLLPAAS